MEGELSQGATRAAVHRLQRREWLSSALAEAALATTVAAGLAGALVLVLRGPFGTTAPGARWALALLAAVPFAALARARALTGSGAAARLELATGSTGGLLLDWEFDDPRWRPRAAELLSRLPPRAPLLAARALCWPAAALAFLALALLVRVPEPPTRAGTAEWMLGALGGLAEELRVLEEQVALDQGVQAELTRRLEDLTERAAGADPEALLEAFDALEARFGEEALAATDGARRALESLAGLVTQASPGDGAPAPELQRAALLEAGRELLEQLGGADATRLSPELAALLAGLAEMDPERTRELAERLLDVGESELRRRAGVLAAAGVLREGAARDLLERLARAAELRAAADGIAAQGPFGPSGAFGRGDCPSCGRGDCSGAGTCTGRGGSDGDGTTASGLPGPGGGSGWPLGPERGADGSAGDAEALAGLPLSLDGTPLGEAPGAPEVAPIGEAAGLAEFDATLEGAAWRRRIAPRHRRAVQAFFDTGAAIDPDARPGTRAAEAAGDER